MDNKGRFKYLKASLPKKPGTYLCRIEIIREVDYVLLGDDNLDFEFPDDIPSDAEVIAYKSIEKEEDK